MFKVLGVVAVGCAATMCAAPAVAAELTPDGPASLMNRWTGAVPANYTPPAVLMEVRVAVAAGGRAGTVRIQGMSDGRTSPSVQGTFEAPKLGPEATLPAAPGTYTLPAPRVHMGAFYTRSNDRRADNAVVSVASEGEDLAPLDNGIGFVLGAFRLVAAEQQRVSQGVKVRVSGEGAARLIAAVRVGKRMIRLERTVRLDGGTEQSVTLKAEGATLRTLRRAAMRGPLRTQITVRGADGGVAAKTTATLVS